MKVILDDGPLAGTWRDVPDEALEAVIDGYRYVQHYVDRKGQVHFYHPDSHRKPPKTR